MQLPTKLQKLIQHQGFKRYAANTSWMLAEQMLRIVAGIVVGIWVARYLGPEQFGLFSYVLAFTAIFAGIAKLGLDGILVRELVIRPDLRDTYLGTAFWMKLTGAVLMLALIAMAVPLTTNNNTINLFIFIIAGGIVFQSFEVVEFYFQSQVQAKIVSICKVVQLTLSSLVKIYLVLEQAELLWFVCVTAFDALSLAVSFLVAYNIRNKSIFIKCFEWAVAKKLLKDSWPLVFSSVFAMVYLRIDQIMIKEMLGSHEVGVYSAAVKLSEAFYFIPVLLTTSLFPAILNAKKLNIDLYHTRLQRLYAALLWMSICIASVFSFFGDKIVIALFGGSFSQAGSILVVHVWAGVFVFISAGFGRYLMAENLAIINMYRVVLGAVLNIALNLFMIEKYGVIGAAYSTLISLFFINYIFDVFSPKLNKQLKMKVFALFFPFSYLMKILRTR